MASIATPPAAEPNPEVLSWLKTLPLAPEYHPTLAEFKDPISYIFKIEKEASRFGICKIVPPVPPPPKKTAIVNLNRSLAARGGPKSGKSAPTFSTRQQQIGFCPRRHRPVQKPVWQSGEHYTFQEFEAKARSFERNYLKRSTKKGLSPLEIETLFWKACVDKPFSVEYANDMPGSAFVPINGRKAREAGESVTVGETAWNMRGVSRAKGSLLRFMKEEIPGVTSPMVYLAMMFSWFAWHVEDHDLHSLNYLHMGAGKTWYGVPREAAVAFEEVVRVHGYGGEINPLVTFAILGEKTTVMSPEVFISAGIPCCRLVQNAGEFVVTFPRAYHSGFSHGFNCGEAANIATPEWLRVARDAAIRRASINYPPMVSHFQLLYDLALELSSSVPMSISAEPRSSRLKDKRKGEGETVVKELFVQNMVKNNALLHILGKGSSVVILPLDSSDISLRSNLRVGSNIKLKTRLPFGLSSPEEGMRTAKSLVSDDFILNRNQGFKQFKGLYSVNGRFSSPCERIGLHSFSEKNDDACTFTSQPQDQDINKESSNQSDGLSERGLFSCVTCGILSFECVAIVQPREAAARYLMSADCSFFNDWIVRSGVTSDGFACVGGDANTSELNSCSVTGLIEKSIPDGLYDVPIQSASYQVQASDKRFEVVSNMHKRKDTSALGLLASTYGNSSDSEEDRSEQDSAVEDTDSRNCSLESRFEHDNARLPLLKQECHSGAHEDFNLSFSRFDSENAIALKMVHSYEGNGHMSAKYRNSSHHTFNNFDEFETNNLSPMESNSPVWRLRDPITRSLVTSPVTYNEETKKFCNPIVAKEKAKTSFPPRSDEDSSRMHVFCLEHAVEVEEQLLSIGGVQIFLVCHPDYPKMEAEAKLLAGDLGIDHIWNDIAFRNATKEDEENIQLALDSEDSIHGNGDWAVKLGINLFYSASLSRSPLYSKQMPYNSVIYNVFGRSSQASSPTKPKDSGKGPGKQKKLVVAGKWCGKVWMSNQVHPLLIQRDPVEQGCFHAWAKPDEKSERRLESTLKSETSIANRKSGRKRRKTFESGSIKKARSPEIDVLVRASNDSLEDTSLQQGKRILRSKQIKQETTPRRKNCERSARKLDLCVAVAIEGGPSTRLRSRASKPSKEFEVKQIVQKQLGKKKVKKTPAPKGSVSHKGAKSRDEEDYQCDMEGCTMSFGSKHDLMLHKRNVCPVKGCGKKFFSHKYLLQHRRVHMDDRPLKCPWKGCKMTFKWAWARTEHIRVHTGARPYVCNEADCGQTFRFVSDFSRHKRKTGHSAKKGRG